MEMENLLAERHKQTMENGDIWLTNVETLTLAFELGVPGVVPPGMMVGSPIVGWVVAPFVTEIGLNDVTDD
jgi:hypothetical protein